MVEFSGEISNEINSNTVVSQPLTTFVACAFYRDEKSKRKKKAKKTEVS